MSFFKSTDAFIKNNTGLRLPQKRAYEAVYKSVKENPLEHKLVVLPTGVGKTGLIGILPFGISEGKVLIITPGIIIREGISDEFDTRSAFNFWEKRNVILNKNHLPNVYRYNGFERGKTAAKTRAIDFMNNADIIITNIHKVHSSTSSQALTSLLSTDFFDLIIIDEAHHSAADSWVNAINHFNSAKVIKLTATPFRNDEKTIEGKPVYEFPMSKAIEMKYIKNIINDKYTNEKLEFVIEDRIVSKEEALKEMDKEWVTRSVAYSPECNQTIVDMSKSTLIEKRKNGGVFHQILAVACGIEHAKQVAALYNESGLKADIATSDNTEEATKAIIKYKRGELDVLVNVNMLGEGFDHPNISIAAIFRPFRSLPPYAQFIGRALRRIPETEMDEINNVAHVIYHRELELDDLWNYYSGEEQKAKDLRIIRDSIDYSERVKSFDVGEVAIGGNVLKSTSDYLNDGIDLKYATAISEAIEAKKQEIYTTAKKLKAEMGFTKQQLDDFIDSELKRLDESIDIRQNEQREELIREELHLLYKDRLETTIQTLFSESSLNIKGNELPRNSSNAMYKNLSTNGAYAAIYINYTMKQKLKRSIDEWLSHDFKQAFEILPTVIESLNKKIKGIKLNE
ncbi:hypothetical protein ASF99_04990 [Exiguobacterium sp. Leaf187]|uniref:DEAD/DEAH box helicase n=1 Tax=Exiguobacterium sp. Leaf187 TaxID=1736294 RepID=UPI0006F8E371|nr:DEAD/DEAH box helicase family protein [Exiguobacterium sp. Leaf187]KQS19245.1 hypothetical protein ASF99_04990 [Exiguobacterium sp. Leaf187]